MFIYLEPQDISCIGSFVSVCDVGIPCKQLYKLRSFHLVRCAFLRFAVTREQTHTKASSDWGVAEGEESCFVQRVRLSEVGYNCPRHTRFTSTGHAGKAAHTYDINCSTFSPLVVQPEIQSEVIINSPPSFL